MTATKGGPVISRIGKGIEAPKVQNGPFRSTAPSVRSDPPGPGISPEAQAWYDSFVNFAKNGGEVTGP